MTTPNQPTGDPVVAYYVQALSKACSDAGVGDISGAYALALGIDPATGGAVQPVDPPVKETPVTKDTFVNDPSKAGEGRNWRPTNLHNPELPDYYSPNPRISMSEAELRSRMDEEDVMVTENYAVSAGISFEDVYFLLQNDRGRELLGQEIRKHYRRKEEQRDKERLDRLMEARAKFSETDENAAKRRRIEEARKRFEELGLGSGEYR